MLVGQAAAPTVFGKRAGAAEWNVPVLDGFTFDGTAGLRAGVAAQIGLDQHVVGLPAEMSRAVAGNQHIADAGGKTGQGNLLVLPFDGALHVLQGGVIGPGSAGQCSALYQRGHFTIAFFHIDVVDL